MNQRILPAAALALLFALPAAAQDAGPAAPPSDEASEAPAGGFYDPNDPSAVIARTVGHTISAIARSTIAASRMGAGE